MRSFLSALFFGLLLSLLSLPNSFVDARINTPIDVDAIKSEPNAKAQRLLQSFTVANAVNGGHRSLGGGVENSSVSFSTLERSLVQQQSWARNDDGNIKWWIWLIIGLCCGLCCVVCCLASACCLRD